jgi:hypothetical protein
MVLAPSSKKICLVHTNIFVPSYQTVGVSDGRQQANHQCEFAIRVGGLSENPQFNNPKRVIPVQDWHRSLASIYNLDHLTAYEFICALLESGGFLIDKMNLIFASTLQFF